MWLLGKLPTVVFGKAVLGALALLLMLMAFEALTRERSMEVGRPMELQWRSLVIPIACALLLTGPLLPAMLGDLFVMPVLWAGVLIAFSVCAYGIDRPLLGVAMGLAAVFFRDLALPYCALCAAITWRQGRRRELALWMLGLAAWMAFFAWHWWQVSELIPPGARRIVKAGSSSARRAS